MTKLFTTVSLMSILLFSPVQNAKAFGPDLSPLFVGFPLGMLAGSTAGSVIGSSLLVPGAANASLLTHIGLGLATSGSGVAGAVLGMFFYAMIYSK